MRVCTSRRRVGATVGLGSATVPVRTDGLPSPLTFAYLQGCSSGTVALLDWNNCYLLSHSADAAEIRG